MSTSPKIMYLRRECDTQRGVAFDVHHGQAVRTSHPVQHCDVMIIPTDPACSSLRVPARVSSYEGQRWPPAGGSGRSMRHLSIAGSVAGAFAFEGRADRGGGEARYRRACPRCAPFPHTRPIGRNSSRGRIPRIAGRLSSTLLRRDVAWRVSSLGL